MCVALAIHRAHLCVCVCVCLCLWVWVRCGLVSDNVYLCFAHMYSVRKLQHCIYLYVCACVCMCVCVCVCVCFYVISVYASTYIFGAQPIGALYIYKYVCVCVCVCACVSVGVCVAMCVCVRVFSWPYLFAAQPIGELLIVYVRERQRERAFRICMYMHAYRHTRNTYINTHTHTHRPTHPPKPLSPHCEKKSEHVKRDAYMWKVTLLCRPWQNKCWQHSNAHARHIPRTHIHRYIYICLYIYTSICRWTRLKHCEKSPVHVDIDTYTYAHTYTSRYL